MNKNILKPLKSGLKFILLLIVLTSCKSISKTDEGQSKEVAYAQIFPDSFFAYKNIQNTDLISYHDHEGDFFIFKGQRKKLRKIDNDLITNWNKKLNFLDTNIYYIGGLSYYYFSKQDKIGNITPIIILGEGDDYTELILISLDQNNQPIDFYTLTDINCSGTYEVNDTLAGLCPQKNSYFDNKRIRTNINHIYLFVDTLNQSLKDDAIIDSITFKTEIHSNGKIETSKVDSIRVFRKYK